MNEDVYKMIDTLHARLDDVRGAVESLNCEAAGYAKKLDKIDDKLYLLQCEIEKLAESAPGENQTKKETSLSETKDNAQVANTQGAQSAETVQGESSATNSASSSSETGEQTEEAEQTKKVDSAKEETATGEETKKKEIFSEDMKENLADAGRAIGNIYRDGKEVITELSGTMGDLKDIFSFGKKR